MAAANTLPPLDTTTRTPTRTAVRLVVLLSLLLPFVAVPLGAWAATPTLEVGFGGSRHVGDAPIVWVVGHDWPGPDVVVTANDPATTGDDFVSEPVTPDASGYFGLEVDVDAFGASWVVSASDGSATADIMIPLLTIDRVDTATNTVWGTAEKGLTFDVDASGGGKRVTTTTNAWSVTVAGGVSEGDVTATWSDETPDVGDRFSVGYTWPTVDLWLSGSGEVGEPPPDAWIYGAGWPEGATVHVELLDDTAAAQWSHDYPIGASGELRGVDEEVVTGVPAADVGADWTVTANMTTGDGWTVHKDFTYAGVRVDTVDQVRGTATGPCALPDGATIGVELTRGIWPQDSQPLDVTCNDGVWTASWLVDDRAVPLVGAGQRDGDWDSSYHIDWQDRPRVLYEPDTQMVTLLSWHNQPLGLYLGDATDPVGSYTPSGEERLQVPLADFDIDPSTIVDGTTVLRFENTTQVKVLEVQPVSITDVTTDGHVAGTAPANTDVRIQTPNPDDPIGPVDEHTTSDDNGDWSISLALEAELVPGDYVRASLTDHDDDANIAEYQLPSEPGPPFIDVNLGGAISSPHPFIQGGGFDPDAPEITVTLDKPGAENDRSWHVPTDTGDSSDGNFFLEQPFNVETPDATTIEAGDVVTVTDGSSTATHTVQLVTVDTVDMASDTVGGTIDTAVTNVEVGGGGWYGEPVHVSADLETTPGGWTADFSSQLDILPFSGGVVNVEQGDGMTVVGWGAPFVAVGIDIRGHDGQGDDLWGGNWCDDSTVTVTVERPDVEDPVWSSSMTVGSAGGGGFCGFGFEYESNVPTDLQVGDLVTVSGTTGTVSTTIRDLAVTETVVSTESSAGSVSGTAAFVTEFPRLRVEASGPSGWAARWPEVTNGTWRVDYDAAPEMYEEGDLRLKPGTHGVAQLRAPDGNLTFTTFGVDEVEPPHVVVSAYGFEYVEGHGWDGLGPVTIDISDPACTAPNPMELNQGEGDFFYDAGSFGETCDLSPRDVVTVTSHDDSVIKQLEVSPLIVTDVDADADTIEGRADPGEVVVQVWTDEGEPLDIPVPVSSDGTWGPVHLLAEHGIDLAPDGPQGAVYQWDDGNATQSDWYVPSPVLHSSAAQDFLVLQTWPTGPDIDVTVHASSAGATLLHTQTIAAPGPYFALEEAWLDLAGFDLQAGHLVTATNGTATRAYTVSPISVDSVAFDSNTLVGTANPSAQLFAAAENESGSCEAGTTADADGTWSISFDQTSVSTGAVDCYGGPIVDFGTHVAGSAGEMVFEADVFQGVTVAFWDAENTTDTVDDPGGGTVSTGTDPTAEDPVETSVTTSDSGEVTITETSVDGTVTDGFVLLGTRVTIETDIITPSEPFDVTFLLDESVAPEDISTIEVLKNGTVVPDCGTPADPAPVCVLSRSRDVTTGDVTITVLTYDFSTWVLAVRGFAVMAPLAGPSDPIPVSSSASVTGFFEDSGPHTPHTALWDWGDGSNSDPQVVPDGTVSGTHNYAAPGIYEVSLTITAEDEHHETRTLDGYVVVYDPDDGFVTGGGWIWSPHGAFAGDSDLEGKATFGFVSRYKKGADVPDGETEFVFEAAGLEFRSTGYDWLVVAGHDKAKFKGEGTVNGEPGHQFMLTATDGDTDTFRIKIWDGEDNLVYDNQLGTSDDSYDGTELGGGSVVIHTKKGK